MAMTEATQGQWRAPRFKAYLEYKDSGVEQLGQIPMHWETRPTKRVFLIVNGATPKSEEPNYWDGDIPWITPDDLGSLGSKELHRSGRYITKEGYESCGTTLVPSGSIVLSTRAPIGYVAVAGMRLCTNQGCRALVFREDSNQRFFYYQILSSQPELESWGQGSTFKELAKTKLESIELVCPPIAEQHAIAEFLDRKTAKIDVLLAKKERLIGLLEERRTAIITRAVTKGLDPNVPMKDSELEWVGKIPTHWEVLAVGRLISQVEQGWSPVAQDRLAELDEWAVIKLSAVNKGTFLPDEHKALPPGLAPDTRYEIHEGDFLLTRANTPDLVGDVCVAQVARRGLMLCDLVYRLTLKQNRIVATFFAYWLLSRAGRYQIVVDARGSSQSMVKVSQGHIRAWKVVLPPYEEQAAIAAFLKRETAKIDALVRKIREGIDRVKEYRSSLISAAVTGKIDVRETV